MHLHHSTNAFSDREQREIWDFGRPDDGERLSRLEKQNAELLGTVARLEQQNALILQQLTAKQAAQRAGRPRPTVRGSQGLMIGSAPMTGMDPDMLKQYHALQIEWMRQSLGKSATSMALAPGYVPYHATFPPSVPHPPWTYGFGAPPIVPVAVAREVGLKPLRPGDRIYDPGAEYDALYPPIARPARDRDTTGEAKKSTEDRAKKLDADRKRDEERLKTLEAELAKLEKQMQAFDKQMAKLNEEEEANIAQVKKLQSQITTLEEVRAAMRKKTEAAIAALEESIKTVAPEEVPKLGVELLRLRKELSAGRATYNEAMATLRGDWAAVQKSAKSIAARRAEVRKSLRDARDAYAKVYRQLRGTDYVFTSTIPDDPPRPPAREPPAPERDPEPEIKKKEVDDRERKIDIAGLLLTPVPAGFRLVHSVEGGRSTMFLRRDGTSWSAVVPIASEEGFRKQLAIHTKRMRDAIPTASKQFASILLGTALPAGMTYGITGSTVELRFRGSTHSLEYSDQWKSEGATVEAPAAPWSFAFDEAEIRDDFSKEIAAFAKAVGEDDSKEAKEVRDRLESLAKLRGAVRGKVVQMRAACREFRLDSERPELEKRLQSLVKETNDFFEQGRKIDPAHVIPFDDEVVGTRSSQWLVVYNRTTHQVELRAFDPAAFFRGALPLDPRQVDLTDFGVLHYERGRALSTSFEVSHMTPGGIKLFRSLAESSQDDCHLRQDERHTDSFYVDIPGPDGRERWYLSNLFLTPRRRGGDVDGLATNEFVLSRLRPDGGVDFSTATTLQRAQVFNITWADREVTEEGRKRMISELSSIALQPAWSRLVREAAERSRKESASEELDEAGMRSFDLPRDQEIAYLAFHQQDEADGAMHGQRAHFRQMASILNARGYNIALPGDRSFDAIGRVVDAGGREKPAHITVDRDPAAVIRRELQALVDREPPIRNVYMELACHGAADGGFYFKQRDGSHLTLNYKQLMEVFTAPEFRDMRFTISTIACYGGWGGDAGAFRPTMLDVPSALEGRVTVITHTQPYIYNESGGYVDALRYYMASGMAFGQAVRAADRYYRRTSGGRFNPEIRRSSPVRPTHTARGEGLPEDARA